MSKPLLYFDGDYIADAKNKLKYREMLYENYTTEGYTLGAAENFQYKKILSTDSTKIKTYNPEDQTSGS